MPARAIGTGSISFGLVAIPVKMYSATQANAAVSFNMLHQPPCGSRLKQQYICAREEVIVPRDEMVKGYEFAKDQYVVFTTEELKALEERATQSIDITEFVPMSEVDPVYYDKAYYLAPEKGGEKAYHLLAEVMKTSGRSALARYAARGKQYLVMIRPADQGLVMQQLLYADEVRPFAEVPMPEVPKVRDAELKLAQQLVDQISNDTFEPTKYEDEVKTRVLADIQRKVEGQEIEAPATEEQPAQVIDLMEALKASLAGGGGGGGGKAKAAPAEERKPAQRAVGGEDEEAVAAAPKRKASARARAKH
ncbi:MAG TPA: Ku protein [Polyangia bacterium]